jgi:uncharacterized protein YaeQ
MLARTINFADDALTVIDFDFVSAGAKVIDTAIVIAATVAAVCTYAYTALQLWWEENGEITTVRIREVAVATGKFAKVCYDAGCSMRPVVNYWSARIADGTFYAFAE